MKTMFTLVKVYCFLMIGLLFLAAAPEIRVVDAEVETICEEGSTVVFAANDGNLWAAEVDPASDYEIGAEYRLFLSNNHTVSVYDDELIFMIKEVNHG